MTAAARAVSDGWAAGRGTPGARVVTVAYVADDGAVIVATSSYVVRSAYRGLRTYQMDGTNLARIGLVDPDDPWCYRAAQRMLNAAGWERTGDWTTARRRPVCRVRRHKAV